MLKNQMQINAINQYIYEIREKANRNESQSKKQFYFDQIESLQHTLEELKKEG